MSNAGNVSVARFNTDISTNVTSLRLEMRDTYALPVLVAGEAATD